MTNERKLLQIGEFAKRTGTNLRTLRYYEELGLIHPASRSSGGFRYYATEQGDRVLAIKRLQQLGLSLKQVQELMTDDSEIGTVDRVTRALDEQIHLLEARIRDLEGDLQTLRAARSQAEQCRTCGHQLSLANCEICTRTQEALPAALRALL